MIRPPVNAWPQRLSPEKLKAAHQELEHMLEQGVIYPSLSQWASPLHMVSKTSGDWQPYGDYWALNCITKLDQYPIPYIQDFSVTLQKAMTFFKTRSNWSIPSNTHGTWVLSEKSYYHSIWSIWILQNALWTSECSSNFQHVIDQVLSGLHFINVLVTSNSTKEHIQHSRMVSECFK